jgi:hypothetical protein
MTLGLTSSGAIKIKTDGGLRAVNCACCGGVCGCNEVKVPSSIYNILNNITSASQCTLLGSTPTYFELIDDEVNAEWSEDGSYLFGYFIYQKGSPCFLMGYSNGAEDQPAEVITNSGYCESAVLVANNTDFTINGITLPAFYYYPYLDFSPPSSKAVFVFT